MTKKEKEKRREYREKNREDIIKKRRENYKKNRRDIIEKSKKYKKEHKEERKEYNKKHKKEIKEYNKKYYLANKEKNKKYYLANKEKNKKYYLANKEKNKKYYLTNKEKKIKYQKEYREENKEKRNEYRKIKYNNNVVFRLRTLMSSAIYRSLKAKNLSKNKKHWEDLVGYTSQELRDHLENLFQPGMTWNDRGKWHLDHIIPVSFFKYSSTDDVEFKYCWSLNNLQPLWAKDNLKKHAKIIFSYLDH